MEKLDEQMVVRVPSDLREKVRAIAVSEDRSESWVVRRALAHFVQERAAS